MDQIYAPDGPLAPPPITLATSPTVLAGLRIGVLDNLKPNDAHRCEGCVGHRQGAGVQLGDAVQ